MRKMILGLVGLCALEAPAMAASPAACDAVGRDWQAAGFSSPAKPAQARVLGSAGYETSGPELQQMVRAIRRACDTGNPADAVQEAAMAQTLLHHAKGGL